MELLDLGESLKGETLHGGNQCGFGLLAVWLGDQQGATAPKLK
jgi:hypothetical protein